MSSRMNFFSLTSQEKNNQQKMTYVKQSTTNKKYNLRIFIESL